MAARAACLHEVPGPRHDALPLPDGQVDLREQGADGPGLVEVRRGADRFAQAAELGSVGIARGHEAVSRGYPGGDAALRPAVRPNTAPEVSPVPPG